MGWIRKGDSLSIADVYKSQDDRYKSDHVVMAEVLYDAVGEDTELEWLVLYNPTTSAVDISGWTIETAGTSFALQATIPAAQSIAASSYYLVAETTEGAGITADYVAGAMDFQNAGTATDGIRIKDANGFVVDTVLYGSPNTNGLPSDCNDNGISFAPDVDAGHSLLRKSNAVEYTAGEGNAYDSNKSELDWLDNATPTPKNSGSTAEPAVCEVKGYIPDSTAIGLEQLVESGDIVNQQYVEDARLNLSSGTARFPQFLDNGDGSITITDGCYRLFKTDDFHDNIVQVEIEGGTFTLTDEEDNYIVADYNEGSPVVRLTTNLLEINESCIIPIFTILRLGTALNIIEWNEMGNGLSNKHHIRFVKQQRFGVVDGGLILGETGTRNVTCSSGTVFYGSKNVNLDAVDTSQANNDIIFWYHSGGAWTYSTVTQYNNTQYDDGTDLQTLTVNRYTVNWLYRVVDGTNTQMHMVLGNGDYVLNDAIAAQNAPDVPEQLSQFATLVGRIIVQQAANTATEIYILKTDIQSPLTLKV